MPERQNRPLAADVWMRRVNHLHFVGVGGVGMGGIAEVMYNLGFKVSGSDLVEGQVLSRLRSLGIRIDLGHRREYASQCDVLVVSSAVNNDNPEIIEARTRGIPVVPRAQMLAEIMRFRHGIAVTGTHGKTTTACLLASLLAAAGFDPTFFIGGRLVSAGANARLGEGRYLVAEADESDSSFLHLQPMIAVVTNIDDDHLNAYGGSIGRLRQAFVDFLHNLPFYGLAVLCADDPVLGELLSQISRPQMTYGITQPADLNATDIVVDGARTHFRVHFGEHKNALKFTLNLPGKHNVQNALAAIAVAHELGIDDEIIVNTLSGFEGIKRRIQSYGELKVGDDTFTLLDDYAHHPRELQVTLDAIRASYPGRRVVAIFQPHRFTRLRDLLDNFAAALSRVDVLLVMEVYAADEEPIEGADARSLCQAIRARGCLEPVFVESADTVLNLLPNLVAAGDVLITMGAGDIGALPLQITAAFKRQENGQ